MALGDKGKLKSSQAHFRFDGVDHVCETSPGLEAR